jgi:hypothetical protein
MYLEAGEVERAKRQGLDLHKVADGILSGLGAVFPPAALVETARAAQAAYDEQGSNSRINDTFVRMMEAKAAIADAVLAQAKP